MTVSKAQQAREDLVKRGERRDEVEGRDRNAGDVADMIHRRVSRHWQILLLVMFQQILSRQAGHLLRCQRLDLPSEGQMAEILDHHRRILDGIEARDPEAAAEAMRVHLSGTISRLDALRARFPVYFSD